MGCFLNQKCLGDHSVLCGQSGEQDPTNIYVFCIWKEDLVLKLCLYLHLPDEHSYPLPAFPSSKPIVFFWVIFQDNNNIRFQQDPGKRRICFSWNVFPWRKCSFITPSLSLSLSILSLRKAIITIKQLHIHIHM